MGSSPSEPFASWLQARLAEASLRPRTLAQRLGIHASTIGRWLSGATKPQVTTLAALAKVLDVEFGLMLSLAGYAEASTSVGTLTAEEAELLAYFRRLSPRERRIVLAAARGQP